MRQKLFKSLPLLAALIIMGLLILQYVWFQPAPAISSGQYADKVNLALRWTADQLLRQEGDLISNIPPVKKEGPNVFLLRLNRDFDYEGLPPILEQGLVKHGIEGAYDVMVVDCESQELMLGYTADTRVKQEWAPCGGRIRLGDCYHLKFTAPAQPAAGVATLPGFHALTLGIGLLVAAYILFSFYRLSRSQPSVPETNPPAPSPNGNGHLRFGHFTLDVANQLLTNGRSRHELTYRETKLLRYLCSHCNQLLERDQILKAVWEDEGILVGRSLDVFVSRLRKKLNGDGSVRISSVHGVGYKLEVGRDAEVRATPQTWRN